MPGGRPSIYDPIATLASAQGYLADCQLKAKVPTKAGLALALDVARETLYAWAGEYPEFSDIMEKVGSAQEEMLIQNGLAGTYNSTIVKVLLTKHGYSDKLETETKVTGTMAITGMNIVPDGNNIQDKEPEANTSGASVDR